MLWIWWMRIVLIFIFGEEICRRMKLSNGMKFWFPEMIMFFRLMSIWRQQGTVYCFKLGLNICRNISMAHGSTVILWKALMKSPTILVDDFIIWYDKIVEFKIILILIIRLNHPLIFGRQNYTQWAKTRIKNELYVQKSRKILDNNHFECYSLWVCRITRSKCALWHHHS